MVWSTRPYLASAFKTLEPSVLATLINVAFRLPEVSLRYLYGRILDAQKVGTSITLNELRDEISFRERSHSVDPRSAYSSLSIPPESSQGIPSEDADSVPPLVTSIQPGTIASFPLRYSHAEAYIGEGAGARTVLVGDAAHTTHPLAGQGLNAGLGDVESLANCIVDAVRKGGDIGELLLFSQLSLRYKLHAIYVMALE